MALGATAENLLECSELGEQYYSSTGHFNRIGQD